MSSGRKRRTPPTNCLPATIQKILYLNEKWRFFCGGRSQENGHSCRTFCLVLVPLISRTRTRQKVQQDCIAEEQGNKTGMGNEMKGLRFQTEGATRHPWPPSGAWEVEGWGWGWWGWWGIVGGRNTNCAVRSLKVQ